jgi:KaiC/GvpD/RAD55 family RecA-like ATPase
MSNIEIKKNKKLNLKIPTFTCDGSINDNLNNYDMLQNLNGFKFTILIGKPGSGKTSLLIAWLTGKGSKKIFRKVFDNVIVVMPSTSRASMKKNVFKNHSPEKLFDELDYSTVSSIEKMLSNSSDEKETTLLILDDVGASLKNNEIQKQLRKIIYNRRHMKVHIVMLLQSYVSIPREIRKLANSCIMFKPSKVEFITLFEELFESKKDEAMEVMKVAFTKPHDYLFLNVDNQRMFKDYDELIIKNNNLDNIYDSESDSS